VTEEITSQAELDRNDGFQSLRLSVVNFSVIARLLPWQSKGINMKKSGYIYILTNQNNTTLYIGVTSDLIKRIWEHKNKLVEGFTKKYNLTKLVYFEDCKEIELAIQREKQLKAGSRLKKEILINKDNSKWKDLYDQLV